MKKIKNSDFTKLLIKSAMIMLLCLFTYNSYSITVNSNDVVVCSGSTGVYSLTGTSPNITYTWTIYKFNTLIQTNVNTVMLMANNQANIQWLVAGEYTISVSGNGQTATYDVLVLQSPNPYITSNSIVGCQEGEKKHQDDYGLQIVDDANGCVNVCEFSSVNYTAHGQTGSYFVWTVSGGTFSNGQTTISGTSMPFNPMNNVTVNWGLQGPGLITVTEYTNYIVNCPSITKTVCLNIIEKPIATFSMDNAAPDYPSDNCYDVCLNQVVNFIDYSTASLFSPIISWEWDFGDNSFSQLQNPTHQYTSSGNYTVTLTVTNKCNCKTTYTHLICVSDMEALTIKCPSVICENQNGIYTTLNSCGQYNWSVTGGQIVGQTDPEVTVLWDNIGADGFGYLSLDGSFCDGVCPVKTTLKIPVIKAIGSIVGPTDVCINKSYRYKLPAWPATNFKWSMINNNGYANFVAPEENAYDIEILTTNLTGNFTLKCDYVNTITECSGVAYLDINVTGQPVIVNPPAEICVNNAGLGPLVLNTSVAPVSPSIIQWNVKKPNGTNVFFNGAAGSSTISISAATFANPGIYVITADYNSGVCDPDEIKIKVKSPPSAPTYINGDNMVCLNYPYSYNGDVLEGTTLSWSVIGGVLSNVTGNSVTVIWNSSGTKSISSYRTWDNLPGCSSSAYTLNVNHIAISGTILVPALTCEDGSNNFSITTNYTPETYLWSLSPAGSGSISQGQGTASPVITWNHVGNTFVTVKCMVVKCGIATEITQQVQIYASPTYTLTATPNPVCSGSSVSFSLSSSVSGAPAASAVFSWNFGDGSNGNTPPSTTTHTYFNYNSSNSTYPVTLNIANSGCGNATATVFASVEVKPSPSVNISPGIGQVVCTNNGIPVPYSINLTSSASANVSYLWHYNASPISGQTNSTLTLNNSSPTQNGIYTLVVTNIINGCTATSNQFNLVFEPCSTTTACTPVSPWATPVLTQNSLVNCAQAQAFSNASNASNIWGYSWVDPYEPGYLGQSNTANSISSSPVYQFNKPGVYWLQEVINYKDVLYPNDPTKPCAIKGSLQVTIPLVVDFTMHLTCNGSNSGYQMTLKDHSAKYYNQSWGSWAWYIDGNTTPAYTTQDVTTPFALSSGSHTIKLKVTLANNYNCELVQSIVVPNLPVADFSVTSTDPQSNAVTFSSCEGNEVIFNNNSTTMTDLVNHVWSFGDGASLHMQNGVRVYDITIANQTKSVSLIVTDKYGCIDDISKSIDIYNNDLSGTTYTPQTQQICPGTSLQIIHPNVSYGYSTCPPGTPNCIQSQWYYGITPLGNAQYTSSYAAIGLSNALASGAYWVKVTDAHGCYINVNPDPAKVSIKNAPTAIIEGNHDFCFNSEAKLKAVTGVDPATVIYSWLINPGAYTYNTREINLMGLPSGNYTATLAVNQIPGCPQTSQPFSFTIHYPPQNASLSISPVDCNSYQLQLHASTSVSPAYFNWSDGQSGQTITISHGGPYRLYLTDQYGCQSKSDIEVPESPETYFWRFPTGCYTFCPGELVKWVDGPKYKIFDRWEWYFNGSGNIVPDNGPFTNVGFGNPMPYDGSGSNSITDRLLIDLPANAMGSGDYSWMLDNGLCSKESGIMNIYIPESCCDLEFWVTNVICYDNGLYNIDFGVNNFTPGCSNPVFNLSIIDPLSGQAIGYFSNISLQNLSYGLNNFTANLQLTQNILYVKFKIEVFCNSYESCIGWFEMDLPPCGDFAINQNKDKTENTVTNSDISSDMQIMPNPANSNLSIRYLFGNSDAAENNIIRIYDATARPVMEFKPENIQGEINLDVSRFAQGIYFVQLISNNRHILSKRLIINH